MVTVVFGARGNVGRHVVSGLLAAGEPVRVTSRDPAASGFPAGTDVATADLDQPETLPAALAGAGKVFLYARPAGIEGFVEAARAAGVRHLALLSSQAIEDANADRNPIARQHRAVEVAIERSGIDWTFIRPGIFATNSRWWWAESIRRAGSVRLPYPDAHSAPVHEKDIAALAVTALTGPGHGHQVYTVLGPVSLTLRQQVADIGTAIDRDIGVDVITAEQAREALAARMPAAAVDAVLGAWRKGLDRPAPTSDIVQKITGRPGRTFAEWAADHADDFR
jgi:uncharacterized protein YbjT (DUF2867 family)